MRGITPAEAAALQEVASSKGLSGQRLSLLTGPISQGVRPEERKQSPVSPSPHQREAPAKGGVLQGREHPVVTSVRPAQLHDRCLASFSVPSMPCHVCQACVGLMGERCCLLLQAPSIELDRPGMWAPRILQARAQAEEATSTPGLQRSRAARSAPAAAPMQPAAAASLAAAVPAAGRAPPAAAGKAGLATNAAEDLNEAAAAVTGLWLADPASRTTETLCQHEAASVAEQNGSGAQKHAGSAFLAQQAVGAELGTEPDSCTKPISQSLPQEPAAELTEQPGSAPAAQLPPGGLWTCRQPCAKPAVSAPLQGCPRPRDVRKKQAGMRRTLSAPHLDSASKPCLIEVTSPALQPAGCAGNPEVHAAATSMLRPAEQQQPQTGLATKDLAISSLTAVRGAAAPFWSEKAGAVQADLACPASMQPTQGSPTPVTPSPPVPKQAPATDAAGRKRQPKTTEAPPAAEKAPADMLIGKKRPGSRKRAKAAGQAAQAGGGQRLGKRRGRPAGSGRTAQAKVADLAQAVAGLESKRPVKKSRKAIEAEEALRSLHKEEATLSGSQKTREAQPGQSLNETHSTDQVQVNCTAP